MWAIIAKGKAPTDYIADGGKGIKGAERRRQRVKWAPMLSRFPASGFVEASGHQNELMEVPRCKEREENCPLETKALEGKKSGRIIKDTRGPPAGEKFSKNARSVNESRVDRNLGKGVPDGPAIFLA